MSLGRLSVTGGVEAPRSEILVAASGTELAITSAHALAAAALPSLHRDPFDRMLVAQASIEALVLVTADAAVRQYGTSIEWAI